MINFNKKGSALLFVIVGITMAAALGVGMFYMTSTSTIGQVSGSGIDRAYDLAMAGKDYTLANWDIRSQLNNQEFIISGTERFELKVTDFEITSTGIVQKGTPFETRKEIKFASPSPAKRHFLDTFENLDNFDTGTQIGSQAPAPTDGDNALDMGSSLSGFGAGSGTWGFLQLKSGSGGGINFTPSWKDAGRCLSYDLQVKIRNGEPYYMAGLNFKVAGSGDDREFYGVSYLKTKQKKPFLGGPWSQADNIPLGLTPCTSDTPSGVFQDPIGLELEWPIFYWVRYSSPAIVLWKRQGGAFTWLAYKVLSDTDFVVDSSDNLVPWSNLQVRLIEAYQLSFTNGGTALINNAIIEGKNSGAKARISGTPIITSGSLSVGNAAGNLTISYWNGIQFENEQLTVQNTEVGATAFTLNDRKNYIRVYYSDDNGDDIDEDGNYINENNHGTPNNSPIDNNRRSNPRLITGTNNMIHWPVDNVSNWNDVNDYMTVVTWDGINTEIVSPPEQLAELLKNSMGIDTLSDTIIKDGSFLTPDTGAIDHSGIALHATGDFAHYTYFDDFAVQY
ncbi:MAG: hypothetical protein KKC46_07550 [Proteobacteria bacterium]|nr:hypothetical protein [Pseudomonadota bacterium]